MWGRDRPSALPIEPDASALSRLAFARLLWVSKATVSKWEARGLSVQDGEIDPEAGATGLAAHIGLDGAPRRGPVPD